MVKLKPAVGSYDHVRGNKGAAIELVEYGDYECPHCGIAYPVIKNIQEKMGSKLRFVFRNFPLAEIHPHATNAAIATEAAARQDRFWEMHDVIFENQHQIWDADLIKYAERIGLDVKQFEADFDKQDVQEKVAHDFESGVHSGVHGTPSFFVNGEKYDGSWDEAALLEYLNGLLK